VGLTALRSSSRHWPCCQPVLWRRPGPLLLCCNRRIAWCAEPEAALIVLHGAVAALSIVGAVLALVILGARGASVCAVRKRATADDGRRRFGVLLLRLSLPVLSLPMASLSRRLTSVFHADFVRTDHSLIAPPLGNVPRISDGLLVLDSKVAKGVSRCSCICVYRWLSGSVLTDPALRGRAGRRSRRCERHEELVRADATEAGAAVLAPDMLRSYDMKDGFTNDMAANVGTIDRVWAPPKVGVVGVCSAVSARCCCCGAGVNGERKVPSLGRCSETDSGN